MTDEIEMMSDSDGIALIGNPGVIEAFLSSRGLPSRSIDMNKLARVSAGLVGDAAQKAPDIAEKAGRWVKLTERSARELKYGPLMKGSTPGVKRAIVTDGGGQIQHIVEFMTNPATLLTNPAILAGAGGIMTQMAMQQSMEEITDYLAKIDAKVDDVLRAQKDSVLADMIGVELAIDEALTIRKSVGRVSEVTWSKIQANGFTLVRTQSYALRQVETMTERIEKPRNLGDLGEALEEVEPKVREWLAVLARCFQLQDAVAVLELDRVMDSALEDLDAHREALTIARQKRIEVMGGAATKLLSRLDDATRRANSKVLLHPRNAPALARRGTEAAREVVHFQETVGATDDRAELSARGWLEAAADVRDKVRDAAVDGVGAVSQLGVQAADQTRAAKGKAGQAMERLGKKMQATKDEDRETERT